MAVYRSVYISFWSDPKIDDDFTPEDKYFYLYLLTNSHTNVSGCYEVSMKQMTRELGYNEDTVNLLIKRMEEVHGVIRYSKKTKEILVLNWHKYNWSKSPNFIRGIKESIKYIKCGEFRDYVVSMMESHGLSGRVGDGMGISVTDTVTDIVSASDSVSDSIGIIEDEDFIGDDGEVEQIDPALAECSAKVIASVDDWLKYKVEKRQGYKDTGKKMLFKTIAKNVKEHGEDAVIGAIEDAMANGYQGIAWYNLKKGVQKGRNKKTFMDLYEERENGWA